MAFEFLPENPVPVAAGDRRKRGLLGRPLTAQQERIRVMRLPVAEGGEGMTVAAVAAALGISMNSVEKTGTVINKKLGIINARGAGLISGPALGVEHNDPGRAAAVIEAAGAIPGLERVKEAIAASGLPRPVADSLIRRLAVKYNGVVTAVRNLKKHELSELLGNKIHLMLSYIDDKSAADANVRDLSLGAAQLIEKKQLVDGQPTVILSDADRKRLHELLPALIAEGRRRGITIEGQVTAKEVTVEPVRAST